MNNKINLKEKQQRVYYNKVQIYNNKYYNYKIKVNKVIQQQNIIK